MFRKMIYLAVVGFWLAMMGHLVYQDRLSVGHPPTTGGYAALLRSGLLDKESQMGIHFRGERVGVTRTSAWQRRGHFEIDTLTRLKLPILGQDGLSSFHVILRIGPNFKLVDFTGTLVLPMIRVYLEGDVKGDQVQIRFKDEKEPLFETSIPYQEGDLLGNVFSPFSSVPEVRPGKSWKIRMFNPLSREFETATAVVEKEEERVIEGELMKLYKVQVRGANVEASAWVNGDGEVMEQEIPRFGLRLVRERTQ